MNIEDAINDEGLPVNTIAMLDRMIDILKENECNNPKFLKPKPSLKYKRCLWLVAQQIYGQAAEIDMSGEWKILTKGMFP